MRNGTNIRGVRRHIEAELEVDDKGYNDEFQIPPKFAVVQTSTEL